MKPLRSLRVVEMGTYITGPACAMQLADLGADVIKVERPGEGDPFRAFKGGLYSPHFQTYNRNKESVTLDTRQPEDLAILDRLMHNAHRLSLKGESMRKRRSELTQSEQSS